MILAWCSGAARTCHPPALLNARAASLLPGPCPLVSRFSLRRARFSLRRARRIPHLLLMVVVVGVVGCSGSGKSSLCTALADALGGEVVNGDDFFRPDEILDALDLSELPWPGGSVPPALANKKTDNNLPSAIDWSVPHFFILLYCSRA